MNYDHTCIISLPSQRSSMVPMNNGLFGPILALPKPLCRGKSWPQDTANIVFCRRPGLPQIGWGLTLSASINLEIRNLVSTCAFIDHNRVNTKRSIHRSKKLFCRIGSGNIGLIRGTPAGTSIAHNYFVDYSSLLESEKVEHSSMLEISH